MIYFKNEYLTKDEVCKHLYDSEMRKDGMLTSIIISGYPSLGKTELSNTLCSFDTDRSLRIESESWIYPLKFRQSRKTSGSNLKSYDIIKSVRDLDKLYSGERVKLGEYSHEIGAIEKSNIHQLNEHDLIVLDGTPFCDERYEKFSENCYCLIPDDLEDWMNFSVKRDMTERFFSNEDAIRHNQYKLEDMKKLVMKCDARITFYIRCKIINNVIYYKLINNKI